MITREQYLNALELIDQYHRQLNLSDINNSSSKNKTLIEEWSEIDKCSTRLRNLLLPGYGNKFYDNRLDKKIEYIEDINERNFMQQRRSGKVSWKEFCDLTGFKEDLDKKSISPSPIKKDTLITDAPISCRGLNLLRANLDRFPSTKGLIWDYYGNGKCEVTIGHFEGLKKSDLYGFRNIGNRTISEIEELFIQAGILLID
jgi:hypothetical protein